MAAKKKYQRIQIYLETYKAIRRLAEKKGQSITKYMERLIKETANLPNKR